MKKILISIATIGIVGAVAFTASQAFFSDTETSENNTFVAGAIDLKVDSECHYWRDGEEVECQSGNWELGNLGPESQFFNFEDIKPGDYGENTISLHVYDNDAYMCAIIDNMRDDDNGLTDPESDVDTTGGPGQGELAQELHFFAWNDGAGEKEGFVGNNVWDENELPLFSNIEGPANDVIDGVVYPLYTPQSETMIASTTQYIGIYWCYGNLIVGNNTLDCEGVGGTNLTQTDSLKADITFYVEQARNNESFSCDNIPVSRQKTMNLDNKNDQWQTVDDDTYGVVSYSTNSTSLSGTVWGKGLEVEKKYQITLNGPGVCTTTDDNFAGYGENLFQSGYWAGGPGLSGSCSGPGEGIYNMNLIGDEYTVMTDSNGDFTYPYELLLPTGSYSGVKVLVKKTIEPFASPWTDPATVHTTNLFETDTIMFEVL